MNNFLFGFNKNNSSSENYTISPAGQKGCLVAVIILVVIFGIAFLNFVMTEHPDLNAIRVIEDELSLKGIRKRSYEVIEKTNYGQYIVKIICDVDTGYNIGGNNVTAKKTYYVIFYNVNSSIRFQSGFAVMDFSEQPPTNAQMNIFKIANKWGEMPKD